MSENEITEIIIGCPIKVHRVPPPGPGLLESAYEECLHYELLKTDLKLAESKVGLLMNFNVLKLTSGIRRVVNNY